MTKISRKQIAMLHVARKQLAMADEDWRAILRQEAGAESSTELDAQGLQAVLGRLEALGFTPSGRPARGPEYGWRTGMASPRQVAYIRSLWEEYTDGKGDDRSLGKWLDRTIKVANLRFVTYGNAARAITALRAMVMRNKQDAA